MLIRIMILSKLTLRMKLDNGCDSALKNTMLPQSSYYLMRRLVQMQVKTNGSNMIGIFDAFLSPAILSPPKTLNSVLMFTPNLREIYMKW